jgi:mannose-6-phosphate isomerase-like protein (cupin superfamily)
MVRILRPVRGVSMESKQRFHLTVGHARDKLPARRGKPYVELLKHGTMSVEFYSPLGVDTQTPHVQDELYVVVSGHGEFINGDTRHAFGPGDVLFVAAGVEHRFVDFSDDFAVWVVFYGPRGGEASQPDFTGG